LSGGVCRVHGAPMTRRLPPLNAVRAFEATARLGSMSLAAAELCVTAGAVSQQIAKLEDYYGRQLFIRRHHQLLLTDTGQTVYATCVELMNELAALTEQIVGGTEATNLVISVLPSVGIRWLSHHLPDFLAQSPQVRIDLRLEEDPVDFLRNRIDVRLSYGEHLYPDLTTTPFARDRVTPMCAPALVEAGRVPPGQPLALAEEDLIHVQWRTGFSAFPSWESWFAAAGQPRSLQTERGHRTDSASVAIELAAAGAGIVLGQFLLADAMLKRGTLVTPFAVCPPLPFHYCAVQAPAGLRNPAARSFIDWLLTRAPSV
jgi:LysR family transcriptional regulator, glycine cleavage system transcriptional activator